MATLWSNGPAAGPSRFGLQASNDYMSPPSPRAFTDRPLSPRGTPSDSASSICSASIHAHSRAASVRSASIRSTSVHSGLSSGRNLTSLFARRGSHHHGRRSKSVRSGESTHSSGMDGMSEGALEHLEMMPLPASKHGKKRMVQEHHEARIDRRKAEAAVAKWRKWVVEQPTDLQNGTGTSSFLFRAEQPQQPYHPYPPTPAYPPHQTLRSAENTPTPSSVGWSASSHTRHEGIPSDAKWNPTQTPGTTIGASSSESGHPVPPSTTSSHFGASLVPGAQNIYTTESVRALRDVELAVDPAFLATTAASPLSRVRRLSTHTRVAPEMENPFSRIDTLLCRRGIRPLVLELVQSLGAYIDAVWCTSSFGADEPCPWAGVPLSLGSRRVSLPLNGSGGAPHKTWKSWTITAVQESKRQGFLKSPPSSRDVAFWGWEIRYGLRDIDEAVNRRKDLGWAFGETVILGGYGDIDPSNVMTPDGKPSNIPRLLNDLEEALWGDALPAPTDLAFEYEEGFDAFSVYREGDELIGVESSQPPDVRDAELHKIFGDYYPVHGHRASLSAMSQASEPHSPTLSVSPRLPNSPIPASPKPKARTSRAAAAVAVLDLSSLSTLQEMSTEEQLELGRRRHQEYVERMRRRRENVGGARGDEL